MASKDIGFTMGLDYASFQKGLNAVQAQTKVVANAIKAVMVEASVVMFAAFGVDKFDKMIGNVFEAGKALDSLSRESGIAAEEIALMTHAFDRSGQTAESTTGILEEMRGKIREARLETDVSKNSFAAFGISIEGLEKKNLGEQFAFIAEKVNGIKEPAMRATAGMVLLGAAGAKAAANFNKEDIGRAARLFGANSKAMAEAAPGLSRASEAFTRIQEGGQAFFNIVISKLAPVFVKIATKLEDIIPKLSDAAAVFAEKLLDAINLMIEAFDEGKLGELFSLSLEMALYSARDLAFKIVDDVGDYLKDKMKDAVEVAVIAAAGGGIFRGVAPGRGTGEDPENEARDSFDNLIKILRTNLEKKGGGFVPIKGPAAPGTEGETITGSLTKFNAFDSFRKVGGGLGAATSNIAQRSLDKLTEISNGIKTLVKHSTITGNPMLSSGAMSVSP